jgi:peptide-methionine (S)-S-oxide reductase
MGLFKSAMGLKDSRNAYVGRSSAVFVPSGMHPVTKNAFEVPDELGLIRAYFAMGCFWGAEKLFYSLPVYLTTVGYSQGNIPNPTYEEVCSGNTGHVETVEVIYDPKRIDYEILLKAFWENHDPTQGMRQGNDVGPQYRSGIYYTSQEQKRLAEDSKAKFGQLLSAKGYGPITTEILPLKCYYYAEEYHQQYLYKNPYGYCSLRSTGAILS